MKVSVQFSAAGVLAVTKFDAAALIVINVQKGIDADYRCLGPPQAECGRASPRQLLLHEALFHPSMVKEVKEVTGNIIGGLDGTSGPMPDQTGKHIDHGDPPPEGSTTSSQPRKPFVDKGDPGLETATASTTLAHPVGPSNPGDPGPEDNKKPTARDGFKIIGTLGAGGGGDPGPDDNTTGVTIKPGGHGGIVSTPTKTAGSGGTDVPLKDPKEPNDPPDHPIGGSGDPGDTRVQTTLGGEATQLKGQLRGRWR